MTLAANKSLGLLGDLLFRNWGTKIIALVLATVVFIVTRDEVTREFDLALRTINDPDRVLLTELPASIQVQVRGPWTRVSRLLDSDFEPAELDLAAAPPGPLEIDRGSIVMPAGVVLAGVHYDHVDLRFEPVVVRDVVVVPTLVGEPAVDFHMVRVEAEPEQWPIRGGRSAVHSVDRIVTEALDISGAVDDVEQMVGLERPSSAVRADEIGSSPPRVKVTATIEPILAEQTIEIAVPVTEELARRGVPTRASVKLSGPRSILRGLDQQGLGEPIEVSVGRPVADGDTAVVELEFSWAAGVPEAVVEQLRREPERLRVVLAPPVEPAEVAPAPPR